MAKNTEKAKLAELSYKVYEEFLHKVFIGRCLDIQERKQLLLYCFIHRGITAEQVVMLFGSSEAKRKSILMMVKRLRDNGLIMKLRELKSPNEDSTDVNENVFLITSSGVDLCADLIKKMLPKCLPGRIHDLKANGFKLTDVIEYLSERCLNSFPSTWNHYLSARDINTYLLSNPFSTEEYEFQTEVGITEYGTMMSLYMRSYLGVSKMPFILKSDAVLQYKLGQSTAKIFVEQDTGSQRSAIILEKVSNYRDCLLHTPSFAPEGALLFSLQTKVDSNCKELKECKSTLTNTNLLNLNALECMFSFIETVLPGQFECRTVGEAISILEKYKEAGRLAPCNLSFLETIKKIDISASSPLMLLRKQAANTKDEVMEKREELEAILHHQKYRNRRNLIHRAISNVPDMGKYYSMGFSLYTLHNNDMERMFPYLLPEMFQFKNKLKHMLVSYNIIGPKETPSFDLLYTVVKDSLVMRNSYYFSEANVRVIVENISDDIGGKHRINQLLQMPSLPSSLISSKIICLCDKADMVEIKNMYLSSPMGMRLSQHCGSRFHKDGFEIVFAIYETVQTFRSLFTFSENDDIIYKGV